MKLRDIVVLVQYYIIILRKLLLVTNITNCQHNIIDEFRYVYGFSCATFRDGTAQE